MCFTHFPTSIKTYKFAKFLVFLESVDYETKKQPMSYIYFLVRLKYIGGFPWKTFLKGTSNHSWPFTKDQYNERLRFKNRSYYSSYYSYAMLEWHTTASSYTSTIMNTWKFDNIVSTLWRVGTRVSLVDNDTILTHFFFFLSEPITTLYFGCCKFHGHKKIFQEK